MPELSQRPQLAHLGVYTDHQDEMQAFYERVLGLVVTDVGVAHKFHRRIVFMSSSPEQHHQFVLVRREPSDPPRGPLFQVSFKVQSLDDLRAMSTRAEQHGATNIRKMNHGNSWSLYFNDPEDNMVEIYLDTPWHAAQPFAEDLDLALPDAEILRLTEQRMLSLERSSTAGEWSQGMTERLQNTPFKD